MKPWVIIVIILAVTVCFCLSKERYDQHHPFLSQWYAKGKRSFESHGDASKRSFDYQGNPIDAQLMGGPPGIPKTYHWKGSPEVEGDPSSTMLTSPKVDLSDPASTSNYLGYSLYSTKVWPTTYQPVTNTCFDEFMRECSPSCNNVSDPRSCLESCQLRATETCSKKKNIPAMVVHSF